MSKPVTIRARADDVEAGVVLVTIDYDGVRLSLALKGRVLDVFAQDFIRAYAHARQRECPLDPQAFEQLMELTLVGE